MKKNLLRLASLLMAAALTFSAAGCGGAKEENAAPTETTEDSVSAETEEAAAEIAKDLESAEELGETAESAGEPGEAAESAGEVGEAAESAEELADDAETAEELGEEAAEDGAGGLDEFKPEGAKYGYAGDDPTELAAYKYMAEEVSKNFDKAEITIPTVNIFHADYTNAEDVILFGDFWVENYNIDGETLKCVSGGHFPGVMHLAKDGDGYTVSDFTAVEDGEGFDESAKELFGEHYDDFMTIYSDSDARAELRKITVSDYVNLNGIPVYQYQDEGWDPVELYR